MSASKYAEIALLVLGTAAIVLSCLGVLSGRTAYDKLHFAGPAAMLGIPLLAVAIVVSDGFTTSGVMACLVALTVALLSPVATHVMARAIRIREYGHWIVMPHERPQRRRP